MTELRTHAAARRIVTALALLVALAALAAPARPGGMPLENRIFLTARAPFGDPRAHAR
jgi:hypothetical protein